MNQQRRKKLAELRDRLSELQGQVTTVAEELQDVCQEEQEYLDNMPESLQDGEKGQKSQAEAVYSAMCVMNNIGGQLSHVRAGNASVVEHAAGHFVVSDVRGLLESEVYDDQAAFAAAYGLDHGDEYQSAVAAAAGGLTQTAIER